MYASSILTGYVPVVTVDQKPGYVRGVQKSDVPGC